MGRANVKQSHSTLLHVEAKLGIPLAFRSVLIHFQIQFASRNRFPTSRAAPLSYIGHQTMSPTYYDCAFPSLWKGFAPNSLSLFTRTALLIINMNSNN